MGNSDSNAYFRENVDKLVSEDIDYNDDKFWDSLIVLNISMENINQLIQPNDIRTLRTTKQDNTVALFHRFLKILRASCQTARTTAPPPVGLFDRTITVVRLITRLLPFLFEDKDDEFINTLLWGPSLSLDTTEGTLPSREAALLKEPIAVQLLHYLCRLLFLNGLCVTTPGVCLDTDEALPHSKVDTRFIWKGGVGTEKTTVAPPTKYQLTARTDILRCILFCLSGPLFQTIDEYQQTTPLWLRTFADGSLPYTANLFCSLLSTVCSYVPSSSIIGIGGPQTDVEDLVCVCAQLLLVVFDFLPQLSRPVSVHENEYDAEETLPDDERRFSRNVYRLMLQGIRKESELEMILNGMTLLLSTVYSSQVTLMGGVRGVPFIQELLLLLWHIITANQSFVTRLSTSQTNQLLVSLVAITMEGNTAGSSTTLSNTNRFGLLHICAFLLLVFSSEREFAVRLNTPITCKLPSGITTFNGCHADLLTICVHRVVIDNSAAGGNNSLIDMFLTVLCNISAYVRKFTLESCVCILSMVDRFSRPAWLFRSTTHFHDLIFLLDILNNILQYQYQGNQQLVYSILRQKHIIDGLKRPYPHELVNKMSQNNNNNNNTHTHTNKQSVDNTHTHTHKCGCDNKNCEDVKVSSNDVINIQTENLINTDTHTDTHTHTHTQGSIDEDTQTHTQATTLITETTESNTHTHTHTHTHN
eukprot:GHVR01016938.1.p1 GENE.GHVR01016938.1~~GHVR01016938.1.p1  ORF type:complete len:701 (+),score=211.89 GHVR01016938.1:79-2181(+)